MYGTKLKRAVSRGGNVRIIDDIVEKFIDNLFSVTRSKVVQYQSIHQHTA